MSERQFIPVEGDPTPTAAENEAREAEPGSKKMAGIRKMAGTAAIVGASMLHPEAALGQQQDTDRQQKIEREVSTEDVSSQWLAELAATEPELHDVKIFADHRGGGIEGDGVYRLTVGSHTMYAFTLSAKENTQSAFNAKIEEFLNGDDYKKESPEGVTMEIGRGAAKVMGLNRIFIEHGVATFLLMDEPNKVNLAGGTHANKTITWEKVNDNELKVTAVEADGTRHEYSVRDGVISPEEKK